MPSTQAVSAATEIIGLITDLLAAHDILPPNHKELRERDTATLIELIDRHFPYAELNAKFVRETAESLAWMHDDKSLGLALGARFHIEGIAALRKQRDQANDIINNQQGEARWMQERINQLEKKIADLGAREPIRPISDNPKLEAEIGALYRVINDDPLLQSLLYDLDRLPEQLEKGSKAWRDMLLIAVHWAQSKGIASPNSQSVDRPPGEQTVDRTGEALGGL